MRFGGSLGSGARLKGTGRDILSTAVGSGAFRITSRVNDRTLSVRDFQ